MINRLILYFVFLIGTLFGLLGCASRELKPLNEYVWNYVTNSDQTLSLTVSGTRFINYNDKVSIDKYQNQAKEFAQKAGYTVCPSGYAIRRGINIDYQSEDCAKKSYVNVAAINAGEEPLPSYCTFPIYSLTITCQQKGLDQEKQVSQFEENPNGLIEPATIQKVLFDSLSEFRGCYPQQFDKAGVANKGLVNLIFTIKSSGSVSNARVGSDNGLSKTIIDCITEKLAKIKFPALSNGGSVDVKQSMNFYPKTN